MSEVRFLKNANTLEEVLAVKVPTPTHSYQPVSNEDLIVNLKKVVEGNGLKVTKELYQLAQKDQQLFGAFTIQDEDTEVQKCIGFRNSYNKTLPLGFVAGAEVIVCSNLMFAGEIKMLKKHTVNVFDHVGNMMFDIVQILSQSYAKIKKDKENLKLVKVDKKLVGDIVAEMFLEKEIITINQLSVFKDEYRKKEFELDKEQRHYFPQNGWDIMNHLTESLKKEHPSTRMDKQLKVHEYLVQKLELI